MKSLAWRGYLFDSVCGVCALPVASRCCGATCQRSSGCVARIDGLDDLALTTNGVLLADHVEALRAAGLQRVTVSLDTLDRAKFTRLTRVDELIRVRQGLAAAAASYPGFKIDTVLVRGINDEEVEPLLHEARTLGAELRFIEYMDVGGATRWTHEQVIARDEILAILRRRGPVAALDDRGWAPAERFALADGQTFGIIASTTTPFCAHVRSQPADSGRPLVSLPVRARWLRSPWRASRGRVR